jgi:hypothetical protein
MTSGISRGLPATKRLIRNSSTPLLVAGTAAAAVICLSVVITPTITAPFTRRRLSRRPRSQPQRQHQPTPEAVDAMVDPTRRRNFASHLSGLNIVLETREGLEATTTRCADWLRANGFGRVSTPHLIGPVDGVRLQAGPIARRALVTSFRFQTTQE